MLPAGLLLCCTEADLALTQHLLLAMFSTSFPLRINLKPAGVTASKEVPMMLLAHSTGICACAHLQIMGREENCMKHGAIEFSWC